MRLRYGLAGLVWALALSPCEAQRKPPTKPPAVPTPKPASVEGDVYLVTKTGDVKKAAANTVRLVAATEEVLANLDSACAQITRYAKKIVADSSFAAASKTIAARAAAIGGTAAADIETRATTFMQESLQSIEAQRALRDVAIRNAEEALSPHVVARSPTGINAHYRFTDVRPGTYLLVASTEIDVYRYQWLTTVIIGEAQLAKRDLDNSVLTEGITYCRRP